MTERRWTPISQGERSGTDPSPTDLRRNQPSEHLDLEYLASRTVQKQVSVVYQPVVFGHGKPRK